MPKLYRRLLQFVFASLCFVQLSAHAQNTDILTMGDSITAGLFNTGSRITCAALGGAVIAANNQRSCKGNGQEGVGGWQPRLKSLANSSVYNFGNSGERTSEMLPRFGSHLAARNSTFVLIMGGTNDVIAGIPTSTIIANLTSMINTAKSNGRTPIIGTIPPLSNSIFNGLNGKVVELNNAIKGLSDVLIADHYSVLASNWGAHTSGDFIHLGNLGNQRVADIWFAKITEALVPPEPEPEPEPEKKPLTTPILSILLDE